MLMLILILIKRKFYPGAGHEGTDGGEDSSILSSTSALDGVGRSAPRPGCFNPGKETRYPLCWGLGGPQCRSGRVRKISPTPGFDPRTVQSVASCSSDYAILVHILMLILIIILILLLLLIIITVQ